MIRLYQDLFKRLDQDLIKLVYFKSSKDIDKAMNGEGDLDVYLQFGCRDDFKKALIDSGFFKVIPNASRRYSEVDNYIGYCADSGAFGHIHIHYQMVVGPDYAKSLLLRPGDVFKESTTAYSDQYESCHVISSRDELRLAIFRWLLKVRCKDFFTATKKLSDLIDEIQFLERQVCDDQFSKSIRENFRKASNRRVTLQQFLSVFKIQDMEVKIHLRLWLILKIKELCGRIYNKVVTQAGLFGPHMNLECGHGKIIAFVGCDGSGKSSLLSETSKTIGSRINTTELHFGKPGFFLLFFARYFTSLSKFVSSRKLQELIFGISVLILACARRLCFKKAEKQALKGKIVFLDRLFVRELGLDGGRDLKLVESSLGSNNLIFRFCRKMYNSIGNPSLLFVINAPIKTILERRAEDDEGELLYKKRLVDEYIMRVKQSNFSGSHVRIINNSNDFGFTKNGLIVDVVRCVRGN